MVFRGLNPTDLSARWALAYVEHREDLFEQQKEVWKEAAAEMFGED